MDVSELRKNLHKYLDEANDSELNFLKEAVEAYISKDRTLELESTIKPPLRAMNDDELFARIERSEENFKNGKFFTEEQADLIIQKLIEKV